MLGGTIFGSEILFIREKPPNIPSKVEISFKVGSSILSINGNDVEVETPYVIGGVTLVPIRVITEAFGAAVDWISETRKIIISCQDVEVRLQIFWMRYMKQDLI